MTEDNALNVMVAEKFLKTWNLKVEVARNGQEAIELVKKDSYDLVLMDLHMPVLDGYETTQAIRKFNQKIPIVALTASAFHKVRQDIFKAGMNDYIMKPLDPDQLNRKIKHFLIKS